ncbi:hypothetical protein K7G98_14160 [Saccharothrix sp. MB29]|nr:hypothetical protein [Saccharothrix sp. MB29]
MVAVVRNRRYVSGVVEATSASPRSVSALRALPRQRLPPSRAAMVQGEAGVVGEFDTRAQLAVAQPMPVSGGGCGGLPGQVRGVVIAVSRSRPGCGVACRSGGGGRAGRVRRVRVHVVGVPSPVVVWGVAVIPFPPFLTWLARLWHSFRFHLTAIKL